MDFDGQWNNKMDSGMFFNFLLLIYGRNDKAFSDLSLMKYLLRRRF